MTNLEQQVFIGVASIPSRIESLRKVVESLLPQCGALGVYLNGYSSVPSFLDNSKIVVQRSQVHGDLRDNGKYFFLNDSKYKFYATVDDDILYPKDYISRLIQYLRISGGTGAVGVHGFVLPQQVKSVFENRHVHHFASAEPFLTPVSVLGSGTSLFNQKKWQLSLNEFIEPGMADVWFAKAAKTRNAHLWVIPRAKNWLTPIEETIDAEVSPQSGASLYDEFRKNDSRQVEILNKSSIEGSWRWFFEQLMSVKINRENFCLTQSMQVCAITERLGWSLPDQKERRVVARQVQSAKREMLKNVANDLKSKFSSRWLDVYSQLAVDFSIGLVAKPNSLEFIQQLPLRVEGASLEKIPNCLRWDARVDRQMQLKNFISAHFLSSARKGETSGDLIGSSLCMGYSYEQLISLAGFAVRSDFFKHPDLSELVRTKPTAALEYSFRYLDALPELEESDLPTPEWWQGFFGSTRERQRAFIVFAYLCSKSGNVSLAHQVARDLFEEYGLNLEVFFLSTRLDQLLNRESTSLADRLKQLESQFAFNRVPAKNRRTPKVSIVVTVYNQADEVRSTIENVLSSTYKNIEVLVVDDGSDDATAEVLGAIRHPRVRVIRSRTNQGPYVSRNLAIKVARGDFISFHDCGDYSLHSRVEAQLRFLLNNPDVQAVHTNHLRLNEAGLLRLENNMKFVGDAPVTMMVRQSVFGRIGDFLPTRSRGDIEFLRRLKAVYGNEAVTEIKFPFYVAGAAKNSVKFATATIRRFMNLANAWHKQLVENESIVETWVLDHLAPFEIPEELSPTTPQVRLER